MPFRIRALLARQKSHSTTFDEENAHYLITRFDYLPGQLVVIKGEAGTFLEERQMAQSQS
jgi:hypothetical protein